MDLKAPDRDALSEFHWLLSVWPIAVVTSMTVAASTILQSPKGLSLELAMELGGRSLKGMKITGPLIALNSLRIQKTTIVNTLGGINSYMGQLFDWIIS